jgi:hypothetical protein
MSLEHLSEREREIVRQQDESELLSNRDSARKYELLRDFLAARYDGRTRDFRAFDDRELAQAGLMPAEFHA